MAAHLRHVVRLLQSSKSPSPNSDAVMHVAALLDRTVPASAHKILACGRGCSHCCTQMVALTAPEAFLVAARVRKNARVVAAINEVHNKTRELTLEQRLRSGIMCALLDEKVCSIYPARPLGCHGFVSVNLDACIAAFVNGAPPDIPMPSEYATVLYACRMLLMAALRLLRLNDSSYEMNAALAAILSQENAEARWLAGENVFAGVPTLAPPPPQFDLAINEMAAYVAPTL